MRNRVTPLGDIVAIELRGAWTGNRGNLHQGTDVVRFHRSQLWITCALAYKGWKLPQWAPGRFTVLFSSPTRQCRSPRATARAPSAAGIPTTPTGEGGLPVSARQSRWPAR